MLCATVRPWHSSTVVDIPMRSTPAAPPSALWSCRLHTEYHLQASATSNKQKKHNAATTATVATSVRRCPRLPTSHATSAAQTAASSLNAQKHRVVRCACRSQHASHKPPWCELACAYQSNAVSPAWQEYGACFPHHLDFFALSSTGARRQARTRTIPYWLVAIQSSTSSTPSRSTAPHHVSVNCGHQHSSCNNQFQQQGKTSSTPRKITNYRLQRYADDASTSATETQKKTETSNAHCVRRNNFKEGPLTIRTRKELSDEHTTKHTP